MRASILFLAFSLIAVAARAQDVNYRLSRVDHVLVAEDNQKRASQTTMPPGKADLVPTYVPALAISVITPADPGAVFNGATLVTGPALRLGVQWPF